MRRIKSDVCDVCDKREKTFNERIHLLYAIDRFMNVCTLLLLHKINDKENYWVALHLFDDEFNFNVRMKLSG